MAHRLLPGQRRVGPEDPKRLHLRRGLRQRPLPRGDRAGAVGRLQLECSVGGVRAAAGDAENAPVW